MTCLGEALSPDAPIATVAILERLGHQVIYPTDQTCCGQMHTNSGYPSAGAALAKKLIAAFDDCDAIVAPSSSCVAHARHHDPDAPIFELSEFLVTQLGTLDVGARFPHRVAYHPSCHIHCVSRVSETPHNSCSTTSLSYSLSRSVERKSRCGFPAAHSR